MALLKKEAGNKVVKEAIQTELLMKNIEELRNKPLVLKVSVNEKGGLFKAIKVKDILNEIKKQYGFEIKEEIISIADGQIKEVGNTNMTIKFGGKTEVVSIIVTNNK